jgi:hypothetical protein
MKLIANQDELKQRVQEKLINEYNSFIEELRKEKNDTIIERAYEKVCKQEIVYGFEDVYLTVEQCKALLKCKNILNEGYLEWQKCDTNFDENFDYSITETIEHITDKFQKEQKKHNKEAR